MEAIWVISAFAAGWLVNRFGFPPLVGFLLAGIGLSLNGQRSGPLTDQLADVGVLLLLLTVGLKLRWQSLVGREVIGVGLLHLAVFAALCFFPTGQSGLLAGGLAFSSTVLAVKLLEARRELSTFHGRVAIGILVLQDLVAMVMLASIGAKSPNAWALTLPLLVSLRPALFWLVARAGHEELLMLLGVGLALGLGAVFKLCGVSPELGALFAGALLSGHGKTTEMAKGLWALKEFFLVAFFLKIGLFGLPDAAGWTQVGLFLALLPVKALLFFGLFVLFGLRARTAFVGTLGLSSYSEFALIVGVAAIGAGALDPRWGPILSMTVLLSLVVAAPLGRNVHGLFERYESFLERFERKGSHSDDEPVRLGRAEWAVVGMGRTGAAAYRTLEDEGKRVVGLDADLGKVQAQLAKQRRVVYGDAEDPNLWQHLEVDNLTGILLTLPDLEAKLRATEQLRARGFKGIIGATTYHREEDDLLLKAGCNFIFHPFAAAGERLAEKAIELANR